MTMPPPRTEAEPGSRERLAMELQALPGRSSRELQEAWQRLIRLPQPSKLSRDLLVRIIADKLQQATLGGLPPAAKRRLAALARGHPLDREAAARTPMLRRKRELATTFPGSHVTPRLPIDTKGDGKNERGVVRGS
jgi:hypothetical protein